MMPYNWNLTSYPTVPLQQFLPTITAQHAAAIAVYIGFHLFTFCSVCSRSINSIRSGFNLIRNFYFICFFTKLIPYLSVLLIFKLFFCNMTFQLFSAHNSNSLLCKILTKLLNALDFFERTVAGFIANICPISSLEYPSKIEQDKIILSSPSNI